MMHLQPICINGGINWNVETDDTMLREGIWYIFKKKKGPLATWNYLDACLFY